MGQPARVFCDTSFFYACLDPRDRNHTRARTLVTDAVSSSTVLCTTWDVISETITLLRYRRHFKAALAFLDDVKPTLDLVPVGEVVRREAEDVFRRFGRDHRLSFCDAISFVVVTTFLDQVPCLTFDDDFRSHGLTVLP